MEMSDHEIDAMMARGGSMDETKDGSNSLDGGLKGGEAISGPMTPSKKRRVVLKNPIHGTGGGGKKLMSKSDGFREHKSPDSSGAKDRGGATEAKSPASAHAQAMVKGSPGARPPMGPPGGWVREDKSPGGSPQHMSGSSALERVGSPGQGERLPSPAPKGMELFGDDASKASPSSTLAGTSLTAARAETGGAASSSPSR